MSQINPKLYERALNTEGFFEVEEATLLMKAVTMMPSEAIMLEIGSYYGRSTLFALSALSPDQRWVVVDSFRDAASYSGHSFWKLAQTLTDNRISLLPMTLQNAFLHLPQQNFDLVFVDGDHSFLGVTQDLSLSIALLKPGGNLLCHDVCELFPGVEATINLLESLDVIKMVEKVGSLALFSVHSRPSWLIDPSVYRGEQIKEVK
jgi:predicted O-methyltransferase YrrM